LLVNFQDVPESGTSNEDETNARVHARSVCVGDIGPLKGTPGVILPVGIAANVLLWNAMLDMGLPKADLARKFSVSPTVVDPFI